MLPVCELNVKEQNRIRMACAYLFSPRLSRNDAFITNLEPETLKKAYRKKAKMYHPDFHGQTAQTMLKRRKERFIKVQTSYEFLSSYFRGKPQPSLKQTDIKRKIIAVGGAKGGIGKSMFAANLGVFLSNKGYKTVVVDLDLGGANLHLCLGETFLKRSINDFLNKNVESLQEIMFKSRYGPLLIGGDSSRLGSANISFNQKLNLLKALKQIDTDYVIIDLGGDTTFNIIDFYLAADHGIVMTTCDPTSYLDAYNFIKTALYRKLNRIFGVESKIKAQRDFEFQKLIYDATMSPNGSRVLRIKDLIERVKNQNPQGLSVLAEAISSFNPCLLVNRVPHDCSATQMVKRIQEVSKKILSIKVGYLGSIPYLPEIEFSARNLVPIMARHPNDNLAKMMDRFLENLFKY